MHRNPGCRSSGKRVSQSSTSVHFILPFLLHLSLPPSSVGLYEITPISAPPVHVHPTISLRTSYTNATGKKLRARKRESESERDCAGQRHIGKKKERESFVAAVL